MADAGGPAGNARSVCDAQHEAQERRRVGGGRMVTRTSSERSYATWERLTGLPADAAAWPGPPPASFLRGCELARRRSGGDRVKLSLLSCIQKNFLTHTRQVDKVPLLQLVCI